MLHKFSDDEVEQARSVRIEREIGRRHIHLKGKTDRCGPCPVCGGTDRFSINVTKQVWNCRGCVNGGDIIALVQHLDRVSFPEAVSYLLGEPSSRWNGNGQPKPTNNSAKQSTGGPQMELLEVYSYEDVDGSLLFQTLRYVFRKSDGSLEMEENGKPKKTFRQRRPDPDDTQVWVWG